METARIAQIIDEMGTLLEIKGENPFRCRAYHTAAQSLGHLPADLREMIGDGSLKEVPGIGETMYSKIVQLATTGQLASYDELKRDMPQGLVALLRIPGLGPKKIKALHDELKIDSLADLRAAGESGKIAVMKGFGEKTQANILAGISFVEKSSERILQSTARRLVAPIIEQLKSHRDVIRIEVCGSLRRRAETIGDLDVLISSKNVAAVLDTFVKLPQVAVVLAHGPTKASVRLADGVQCDLRGVEDAQFPFALHYFTGSKAHNIAMRKRAIARGLSLNEYALAGEKGSVACKTEADVFKALGLAEIPPELREDHGEIEAAEAGKLPELIEFSDLTGTFHCHTDWSDGSDTLADMAQAARDRGMAYLGIADHSRSAAYARGLSIERVREQWEAIDVLNRSFGEKFHVFKGTECDILPDGSLDYPDELLEGFDYVVASIHSNFGLSREAMTRRLVRAASNPRVTMLGHPTGRLLLARDGYDVDLDAVIDAAAAAGTMIEINANPHRLDLDGEHCRRAQQKGITIVINPDAHSTAGLDDLEYGVTVARRGWLTKSDVLNTVPLQKMIRDVAKSRRRSP
jgi:DNA polymerase (family 10)